VRSIRRAEALFVGGCQLSFSMVANTHFRRFCQRLVQIGAQHRNIILGDILFGRKTVRKDIVSLVNDLKAFIREKLKSSLADRAVVFTTDLWSDNVVQPSYLDINFYWVETDGADNTDWSIKTAMYASKAFVEKKTAVNIKDYIDEILSEAGCEPNDLPITTDKGANIVAAISLKKKFLCCLREIVPFPLFPVIPLS
jgi:hypothetical protein